MKPQVSKGDVFTDRCCLRPRGPCVALAAVMES
jgi:hypothetical protein